MIELCAIMDRHEPPDIPRVRPEEKSKYCWEFERSDACLLIRSDQPVDRLFFNCPEFTLICRTDLLTPSNQERLEEAPASHLASLYREQGDAFVKGLRGTFAIIVYDHRNRVLKAWTDHFGVERLVFTNGRYLMIATDLRLLPFLRPEPAIDPVAIREYLQYSCIPTPKTIYKGVYKLAPGHQLTSRPEVTTRPYWDMVYDHLTFPKRTHAAWVTDTRNAVKAAVDSNVRGLDHGSALGCFLSGGTDSSSVAGLVGQLTRHSPRTFSIGFDDPRYNEIEYARIAAKRFCADHHEYFIRPHDILSLAQRAAAAYDEPFGNSSIVPTYYCAKLAAQHGVTHLLAGDGGDELFGGNSRYADDRVFQRYRVVPGRIRRWIIEPGVSFAAKRTPLPLFVRAANYVRRANIGLPDRYFSYSFVSSVAPTELFARDFLETLNGGDPLITARKHFAQAVAREDLNRWLYLDLKIIITDNDLRKVTTMSRLAGVTTRYPLLDPRLAEFTGTIPTGLKVRNSQLRYLFKQAMQDVLPAEIIAKTKHGFGLPYSVWVGEDKSLREFTFDVLGSKQCRERGYFRPDLLEWLWFRYESIHKQYYGDALWNFLMLELWHVGQPDSTRRGVWN